MTDWKQIALYVGTALLVYFVIGAYGVLGFAFGVYVKANE
jgi:hypothetical protein